MLRARAGIRQARSQRQTSGCKRRASAPKGRSGSSMRELVGASPRSSEVINVIASSGASLLSVYFRTCLLTSALRERARAAFCRRSRDSTPRRSHSRSSLQPGAARTRRCAWLLKACTPPSATVTPTSRRLSSDHWFARRTTLM